MSSNPKDSLGRFFDMDIAGGKRSNFNVGYKNRISADFFYGYPVGLWDIPADSHFKLDLSATLSTNPTLAPVLGTCTFRVEAYFVEKAAYVNTLRNNEKVPLDRNVPFPTINPNVRGAFSPRCGVLEYLQMLPAGWSSTFFSDDGTGTSPGTPSLNAIPLVMYYDILRNYYVNPQDDYIPIRNLAWVPQPLGEDPLPAEDKYITRANLDAFVKGVRTFTENNLGISPAFQSNNIPLPFGTIVAPQKYPTELDHERYMHHGLWRRTYNNDFFTSYMSNENVELMKSHANVTVKTINDTQVVDVEQISLANRQWRMATRSLLWGNDWKDWNKVHYGVNLMIPYGKPQFLGSLKSTITFRDVISQAQIGNNEDGSPDNAISANKNLGSRAGLAFGGLQNHNGHFVEFNTKDEGYLMLIATIIPDVDYYQGIDPMFFKTNLRHSWMQELNSVGMQDFHRAWMSVVPFEPVDVGEANLPNTTNWEVWNVAEHKVPIWFEYMAKYNQLHGLFTGENQLRYWTFARPFTNLQRLFDDSFSYDDTVEDFAPYTSTYGMPEMFHYIFADIMTDNFQLQFNFDAKLNCMLDKQVIAYL